MTNFSSLNILVLGSRKGLNKALKTLEIPFTVLKDYKGESSIPDGPYTHVLASGEGTVLLANKARESLGLPKINQDTLIYCSDKFEMKIRAREAGINVTNFLPGNTTLSSEEIYQNLGDKVVVKEKNNSGGKGQTIFCSPTPIASNEGDLIEEFVYGQEMSVESFVEDGKVMFTSTTFYHEIGVINIVPANVEEDILNKVFELNKNVIETFKIEFGITHLEVYLTDKGVLFGEIALRPPGGHIMTLMAKAHGIEPWKNYISLHIGEKLPQMKSHGLHAGAIVYHPGKGTIKEIIGTEALDKLKTLSDHKITGKVGEEVTTRDGVGQERAHFIFQSSDRDLLLKEITSTRETFRMVLEEAGFS